MRARPESTKAKSPSCRAKAARSASAPTLRWPSCGCPITSAGLCVERVDDLLERHAEAEKFGHSYGHGGVGQHATGLVEIRADGIRGEVLGHGGHGNAKPKGAAAVSRVKDDAALSGLAHVVCDFFVGVE